MGNAQEYAVGWAELNIGYASELMQKYWLWNSWFWDSRSGVLNPVPVLVDYFKNVNAVTGFCVTFTDSW